MSDLKRCDSCGDTIYRNSTYAEVSVINFDDGYNTDKYNCYLDICEKCLKKKFDRQEILNGGRDY